MVAQSAKPTGHKAKEIADWSSQEVQDFLAEALPGHPCHHSFRYTTGYVLVDLNKDDVRRQTGNDEAANVIWGELHKYRRHVKSTDDIEPPHQTVFVRTPNECVVEMEVAPMEKVASIKARLAPSAGLPTEHQRLIWNGINLANDRVVASYHIPHGAVIRLIPQMSGAARFAPPPAPRGILMVPGNKAWQPAHASKPYMPIVCSDEYRPFPMAVEFDEVADYKAFMETTTHHHAGRQEATLGEHGGAAFAAPMIEVLPYNHNSDAVQTRAFLDNDTDMLRLDSIGDVGPNARREAVLHLGDSQRRIFIVTGDRIGRTRGI